MPNGLRAKLNRGALEFDSGRARAAVRGRLAAALEKESLVGDLYTGKGDIELTERLATLTETLAFRSRFVLLFGEIDHAMARAACERLIALTQDSNAPITMLISSPGGHVESGDAIHDLIRFVQAPVTTVGTGWVASAGTHVFLAAPKERRVCLPNTRFMIHQPSGGAGGQSTDIAIQAKEILRTRERIAREIATQTGTPIERVRIDMERDYWMSAEEAIEYGIVSRVIESHADLKK
jgi:ATP-dependent Clp protease, protease subunit